MTIEEADLPKTSEKTISILQDVYKRQMLNFEFYTPTKIIFGKGTHGEVGKEIKERGFHKVLIHYGGTFLEENGVLDTVHKSLTDEGLEYVDFGGVVPNPRLKRAQEGVERCV